MLLIAGDMREVTQASFQRAQITSVLLVGTYFERGPNDETCKTPLLDGRGTEQRADHLLLRSRKLWCER